MPAWTHTVLCTHPDKAIGHRKFKEEKLDEEIEFRGFTCCVILTFLDVYIVAFPFHYSLLEFFCLYMPEVICYLLTHILFVCSIDSFHFGGHWAWITILDSDGLYVVTALQTLWISK